MDSLMMNPVVVEIINKLRCIYPTNDRVSELFLKIGQVSHFTPRVLTGSKSVFSFQETGKSITKTKQEISVVRGVLQADAVLAELISQLI